MYLEIHLSKYGVLWREIKPGRQDARLSVRQWQAAWRRHPQVRRHLRSDNGHSDHRRVQTYFPAD